MAVSIAEFMYNWHGMPHFVPHNHWYAWFFQKSLFTVLQEGKFGLTQTSHNSNIRSDYGGRNWAYHVNPK